MSVKTFLFAYSVVELVQGRIRVLASGLVLTLALVLALALAGVSVSSTLPRAAN